MKVETRVGLFIVTAIAVFLYLSINIRAFRFNKDQYYPYKAYFDDTGGLSVKAPIRIAGVEVGWVETISLLSGGKAELVLRINRRNKLAKNAYAMIHQDGLIGTKSVEIDPGDPSTGLLMPGSTLSMPGKTPTSVGELLDQFRGIASSIQDITNSIKSVFATRQAEDNLKGALDSIAKASARMADFSLDLRDMLHENRDHVNTIVKDLRESIPSIVKDVHGGLDSFKLNVDKIGSRVDDAGKKVGSAFEQVEDASVQAKDTFREASQVMEKINTGKGVVGKLINEDETYGDLKKTIGGFKEYVTKTQALMISLDMHTETMLRHSNSKGYLEMRLRPSSDYFYLLQLVGNEHGSISRQVEYITRRDDKGNVLKASELDMPVWKKLELADQVERVVRKKNDILVGLQFGKRFDRLALRIGLFENTFGFGLDYYVPLKTDKFHWITTLEAFDMRGSNRLDDTRPHIKWLNKAFFLRNIYTTFGVDDIYSKSNANPFFGGGFRFGDDDLKYFFNALMPALKK